MKETKYAYEMTDAELAQARQTRVELLYKHDKWTRRAMDSSVWLTLACCVGIALTASVAFGWAGLAIFVGATISNTVGGRLWDKDNRALAELTEESEFRARAAASSPKRALPKSLTYTFEETAQAEPTTRSQNPDAAADKDRADRKPEFKAPEFRKPG